MMSARALIRDGHPYPTVQEMGAHARAAELFPLVKVDLPATMSLVRAYSCLCLIPSHSRDMAQILKVLRDERGAFVRSARLPRRPADSSRSTWRKPRWPQKPCWLSLQ